MKLFSIKRQISLKDQNFICGFCFHAIISNEVYLIILYRHVDLTLFVGVIYMTLTFSCIFNIAIICERNSSEVVDPIVIIYDTMIGLDVYSTMLFNET